jgi:hypothetical protein
MDSPLAAAVYDGFGGYPLEDIWYKDLGSGWDGGRANQSSGTSVVVQPDTLALGALATSPGSARPPDRAGTPVGWVERGETQSPTHLEVSIAGFRRALPSLRLGLGPIVFPILSDKSAPFAPVMRTVIICFAIGG